ncbi:peptidase S1 [Marinicauda salina]|uniref:Peptidase S1 n=1 Tax=Marinicauda salina TaxID=2135793 RepID=A0A2U2BWN0_9PROT|nr:peptidase S1 [Marinicauda salina]PWE18428.1 peptidase S1 [Marinicauda salina]
MLRTTLIAAAATAALAIPAAAQDYSLNPSYGTVSLTSGFTPDPHTVNLQSGGSISAANVGSNCRGYIADAPDYRLHYTSGSLPLIISVASSSDTTLVVNGPDGSWYCNDDGGNGLNPSLRWNSPMSGQYDIWVGTYGGASLENAQLHISELNSQ